MLLKHRIFLARDTGKLHKRWLLCWVCPKIQVAQYQVLSCTQRQMLQDRGRSFDTLSTVLPASNHLQLSGPDLVFTYIIYPNGFFFCMNLSPFETMYTLSICTILWQGTQEFNNEEIKNQLLSCICHLLASLDFWFLHWRRPWKPNSFPLHSSRFHRLLPFLHCFVSSGIPKY